ncbi:hypothetical protein, variant [Aphanomyces invadans]|uniref:tetrahydrofolate synthase n=1 Tax=Aphanomyces invadans TaxID=157072 RepID=A0A024UQG1_9STRA|nr:hypothetical protein, variant [Aphanomyces invadans]ETW08691.1 hypothetical protein, variant [Aphanomyces invadans]|eukprot:XP_008862496.1 hypothetical protein, variant [Aphanomyces invadans]
MPRLEEYTSADIAAFRQSGIDGTMKILLSMPNSPGNIVPAAGAWTRDTANAMMRHYMKRTQVDASTLSVVHVAGTKGKGSTCAFTESILRAHGSRTGLFTSPHLIHPNERFRINGTPVSDDLFVDTFWTLWDALEASKNDLGSYPRIPNYFTMLTLMALRMFVDERVDVAILEVGLGGRLDATNVIEKPVVCGITALDYDHTRILGSTLDKIAREKAGIIKAGVPVFTIAQAPEAAQALAACAAAEPSPLVVVPPLTSFNLPVQATKFMLQGQYQHINASLAVALSSTWLAVKAGKPIPPLNEAITPIVLKGLQATSWPGRAQNIVDSVSGAIFHLDGAHTPLSVSCCVAWFESCCDDPSKRTTLIFNCHHERDIVSLFQPLLAARFDNVVFCATKCARQSNCRVRALYASKRR